MYRIKVYIMHEIKLLVNIKPLVVMVGCVKGREE